MENYNSITGIANGAIADKLAVMMNASVADGVQLPTGATVEIVGITRSKTTASGQTIEVQTGGRAKVIAGGTIARGDYVIVNTSGQVVASTTSGAKAIGIAENGASSGEVVSILLKRFTI